MPLPAGGLGIREVDSAEFFGGVMVNVGEEDCDCDFDEKEWC